MWAYDSDHRKWHAAVNLGGKKEDINVADHIVWEDISQVHDICWAPDVGRWMMSSHFQSKFHAGIVILYRSFHLVAVASKEALCIWRLDRSSESGELEAKLIALSKDHKSEVHAQLVIILYEFCLLYLDPGLARGVECDWYRLGVFRRRRCGQDVALRF